MVYKTTIILHSNANKNQTIDEFNRTIRSITSQINQEFDLSILGAVDDSTRALLEKSSMKFQIIDTQGKSYPEALNEASKNTNANYLLYIDNRSNTVALRKAALEAFLISALRNPDTGLFYADYDLETEEEMKEIKLLFHHIGRVRDNQDYGKVFFIRKSALEKISFLD
ncbi:MAG: hypothetical protein J7L04_10070 [Bacteroidales bacterium]|nr:hypothetical protein [Bacteroidales bacterium]